LEASEPFVRKVVVRLAGLTDNFTLIGGTCERGKETYEKKYCSFYFVKVFSTHSSPPPCGFLFDSLAAPVGFAPQSLRVGVQ
jgi:hypothetical protein